MKMGIAMGCILAVSLVWGTNAQPATVKVGGILKERARDLKAQEQTEEEPKTNSIPKPKTTTPVAQPVKAEIVSVAAIKQIQTSLEAVKPKSIANEEQKQQLVNSLFNAAQGAKPPQSLVSKLAHDLAAGWPRQTLNEAEKAALAKNLSLLMNGNRLPKPEFQQVLRETQVIIQYSGMPAGDAQKIVNDLKTLAAEICK